MIPTHHFGERLARQPETRAPRELEPTPQPDGTTRSGFEVKLDQMLEQIGARGGTVGIDIASLERYHFDEKGREAFKTMYVRLVAVARQRSQQVVLRRTSARARWTRPGRPFDRDAGRKRTPGGELTHQARARRQRRAAPGRPLEQLGPPASWIPPSSSCARGTRRWRRRTTSVCHARARRHRRESTWAATCAPARPTRPCAARTARPPGRAVRRSRAAHHALLRRPGGALHRRPRRHADHPAPGYDRGHRVIEEILAGERAVRVRAADAGERGEPVGDASDDRWLSIEDMTAAERDRFQRGYEAPRRRPGLLPPPAPAGGDRGAQPAGRGVAQGGAHWTDTARAHGLRAVHGQRRFAGTRGGRGARRRRVPRRRAPPPSPISTHPDDIVYRVTSPDGRAELELEGWGPRHDADHLPIADLDRALATNAGVRDWVQQGRWPDQGAERGVEGGGDAARARARRAYGSATRPGSRPAR
ncbi:MAG: hypothetical protein HS111_08905 [Kofleriaceae bacterium]|nr:hypothetical protein [Kofleriaceae bacterium]